MEHSIRDCIYLNCKNLLDYPKELKTVFETLQNNGARPIIVGGFVRDALLGVSKRKDIDIEVYDIDSYEKLTQLLAPFGSVCVVGKSFGVCKLRLGELECDFSLPRRETKTASGHKGFSIYHDKTLTFKEAASRRDFTVNALGFDPIRNVLLDEYNGLRDLKNKTLRAVNEKTFTEDPLRILRGVVFAARFSFHFHPSLTKLCQDMIAKNMLAELPKERIFDELRKLFLKSKKPSRAFLLLKRLGEDIYFKELFFLPRQQFKHTLDTLDRLACHDNSDLALFFAAMLLYVPDANKVLWRFTNDKRLCEKSFSLLANYNTLLTLLKNGYSNYDLKKAAVTVPMEFTLRFLEALYPDMQNSITVMRRRCEELGILYEPIKPQITGKDLIAAGLAPSPQFKEILAKLYDLQLQGKKIDQTSLSDYLETIYARSPHC